MVEFSWEPKGLRFAVVHTTTNTFRSTISFFTMGTKKHEKLCTWGFVWLHCDARRCRCCTHALPRSSWVRRWEAFTYVVYCPPPPPLRRYSSPQMM